MEELNMCSLGYLHLETPVNTIRCQKQIQSFLDEHLFKIFKKGSGYTYITTLIDINVISQ